MRRIVLGILLLAVAAGATVTGAFGRTPSPPSSADVVGKMIAALGGRTALESIKSKVEIVSLQLPDQMVTTTVTRVEPDKYLEVDTLPAYHQAITTGYDGTTGWVDDTYGNVKQLTGDQLTVVRCKAQDPAASFLGADKSTTFDAKPDQTVDGKSYIVLVANHDGCPTTTLYVDPKTYLVWRFTDGLQTVDLSDYAVGPSGEKYAKTLAITSGMGSFLGAVTSVKDNVQIDDAIFVMPQKASASPAAPTPAASATP